MNKEEMLKTIEEKNNEIQELQKELDKLERFKKYSGAADEFRALYESFINSGFSPEESFKLVDTFIKSSVKMFSR